MIRTRLRAAPHRARWRGRGASCASAHAAAAALTSAPPGCRRTTIRPGGRAGGRVGTNTRYTPSPAAVMPRRPPQPAYSQTQRTSAVARSSRSSLVGMPGIGQLLQVRDPVR